MNPVHIPGGVPVVIDVTKSSGLLSRMIGNFGPGLGFPLQVGRNEFQLRPGRYPLTMGATTLNNGSIGDVTTVEVTVQPGRPVYVRFTPHGFWDGVKVSVSVWDGQRWT